jgi:3-deoxy-D-manno-octulosonic-acid transferase
VAMGARAETVRVGGNLKYDVRAPKVSRVAELIKEAAGGRPIIVAGSTVGDSDDFREESFLIRAWESGPRRLHRALLVLAPRHPERFGLVESVVCEFVYAKASNATLPGENNGLLPVEETAHNSVHGREKELGIVLLDTIGDLAAVYAIADVAFVGGSLVKRGGHNPLEPAQFGVPVLMGPSYENFRSVVETLRAANGISILSDPAGLSTAFRSGRNDNFEMVDGLEKELVRLLVDRAAAKAMGERGRRVFEGQQGATKRAVEAIVAMVRAAGVVPGAKAQDREGLEVSGLKPGPISEATARTAESSLSPGPVSEAAARTAESDLSGGPISEAMAPVDENARRPR